MKNDIEDVIANQKREDRISHAYLIETNDKERFNDKLKSILKLLLCDDNTYCDNCQNCHFIDSMEHPNVVFIFPEGANIKISQIENLKIRFNTKSTYAKYNIYVILEAEKLNASSGNALLKFLEEPEDNIIGILITNNKSLVLPTITSRCQIFTSNFAEDIYSDDVILIANNIEKFCNTAVDSLDYSKTIKDIEDKNDIKLALAYILAKEVEENGNLKKISILKEIVEKMRYNVNIDLLLLDYIIRMREVNE